MAMMWNACIRNLIKVIVIVTVMAMRMRRVRMKLIAAMII